jgi:hypothetical protein
MRERFSIGSVARLYWDLIGGGVPQTGQVPTIGIWRRADAAWFNAASGLFQPAAVANPMVELDAVNLPGRYYFDFDHSKDLLVSTEFALKKTLSGAPPALAYEDIAFGPLPAASLPGLCSIQGTVMSADGRRLGGSLVQVTLIPVLTDALGRGYQADAILRTRTAADGSFDLPVVQGATVRVEIRDIGYDRRALVPSQPSVLFTSL